MEGSSIIMIWEQHVPSNRMFCKKKVSQNTKDAFGFDEGEEKKLKKERKEGPLTLERTECSGSKSVIRKNG